MNTVHELPKSSSHLLTSAQVITSVFSVVKELVENALDSSCTNIEVKLDNYGLEKIEVRDNGSGIKTVDISFAARSHYTSKIKSHLDLEKIQTYGFRGEALGALCSLSNMTIATKTADEDIGKLCQIGQNGDIVSSKPLPCNRGTVVAVSNLFCNLPVRKQYYKSEKRKKEELKNVEDILIAFACAKPNVRFALYHNKNMIWQKSSVNDIRGVLFQVFGAAALRCMEFVETLNEEFQIKMEAYLPKAGSKCATMGHTTADRCIVLVNKRPVRMKAIDKLLHEAYSKSHENESRAKYPICYVSMTLSSNSIDVNFEPNKTEILFHSSEQVLGMLSDMLHKFYKLDSPASCDKNMEAIAVEKNNSSTAEVQHMTTTINNPLPKEDFVDIIRNLGKDSIIKSQAAPTSSTKRKENDTTQNMIVTISNESMAESQKRKKTKRDNVNATATPIVLNHVRTLKSFFSPPEMTPETESVSSRNSAVHTSLTKHVSKHHSDTESKENEVVAQGRKRHFSDSSLLSSQSSQKQRKVGLSRAANWSRGAAGNEKNAQPVEVLMPNISKPDSGAKKFDNIKPRTESENLCVGKNFSRLQKMDEMVAQNTVPAQNQPSPIRHLSCFDYFCRNKRLEVASLHPEYNNHQIAQVLSKMWNDLADEVKDKYKNYASNGSPKNLQSKEKLLKSVCRKSPKAMTVSAAKATRVETRKPFRSKREVNVTFSLEHLKSALTSRSKPRPKNSFAQQEIKIINCLAPGVWIYTKDKKLSLLNSFRLQETILYHRLLETHELKPEPLPQPIQVFSSALNSSELLLSLSEIDNDINGHSVSDKRITANGFAISLLKSTDEALVKISCVTNLIPFYGVSDLAEVLQILKTKGTTVALSECRPLKVVFYLQGEAVRIARQCCIPSKSDVEDILTQRKWLPTKCEKCIHDKPFSYELCTLDV